MDAFTTSILISLLPAAAVLAYFYWKRGGGKQSYGFLLGFLAITLFYVFSPDPAVIQKLYVEDQNLITPLWLAIISSFFLFAAVFYFKKHKA